MIYPARNLYEPADYELNVIEGLTSQGDLLQNMRTSDDSVMEIAIDKESNTFQSRKGLYIRYTITKLIALINRLVIMK